MRDAVEVARAAGRFEGIKKSNPIALIIENNRVVGFPVCAYCNRSIYYELLEFVRVHKDSEDEETRKDVALAEALLPAYEKHKNDALVRGRWF